MTSRTTLLVGFLACVCSAIGCGSKQHNDSSAPDKHALLTQGAEVPPLVRVDHRGQIVSLRSETPTLVYFYPRDGTPGCTKEACAFRDVWQKYEVAGLRVIGVSSDSEDDHRKFAEEHGLPFSLIADPEHVWSGAFGVGTFAGMDARVSFLVDAQSHIVKAYEDVDPGVHAEQVLTDAQALGLTPPPGVTTGAPEPAQAQH
jgi:peroxiredoxin Q/BCP